MLCILSYSFPIFRLSGGILFSDSFLGNKYFKDGLVDEERFLDFSGERLETVLKYSKKHKKAISYYYDNWEILVDPYNFKLRIIRFLKKIGLLKSTIKIKSALSLLFVRQ